MQKNKRVGPPPRAGGPVPPQYPIESIDNALKLLLLLGEQQAIRLTDASRYLGVASSTAHRVLAMLQYRGFVRQDPTTKAYGPGSALTGVAFSVIGRMDLNRTARPSLQELNDAFNETVHLGALEGSHIRFLDAVESRRAVRVASRVGRSLPAHCTSLGKALLATLDGAEFARLYPEENLEQVTARSISTRSGLAAALQQVRELGYATNREESEEGVASVAAAVPTGAPGLRLGFNVSAPIARMPFSAVRPIARRLVEAAESLAAQLG